MIKSIIVCITTLILCVKTNAQEEIISVEQVSDIFLKFPNVRDFTIASSDNEAYFTIQSPLEEISVIACIKKENNNWLEPKLVAFTGKYKDLEPFLSPDNKRLYFVSNRPLHDSSNKPKDYDIWYVEREGLESNWSKPINIGEPINTVYDEFYPSIAANNNLYFTRNSPDSKGEDDIFFSEYKNEVHIQPISLSEAINSEGYEFNAYISPDESYVIYTAYNRKDGFGSGDLYISFRDMDGLWGKSKNLGNQINSDTMDYCPFVDVQTNTLYFTSKRSEVKNGDITSIKKLLNEINQYKNGLSRIYKTSFNKFMTTKE